MDGQSGSGNRPPRTGTARPSGVDAPGRPLVVLCTGPCCARSLAGGSARGAVERLRAVIRSSPGGILVTAGCLRRCGDRAAAGPGPGQDRAPAAPPAREQAVALVGWQVGSALATVDPLVFAGVDDEPTAAAVADWIARHARTPGLEPLETLPLSLRGNLIA